MRLSTHHRELLCRAGREQLADVVAQIRAANPEAFHTDASLASRGFVDQPPRDIPYASFVLPFEPDDPRRAAKPEPISERTGTPFSKGFRSLVSRE